ncbi:MAG: iron chelate uptake ABC transporter family permease subunit, partial [Usitatibacteraceae bacterium]
MVLISTSLLAVLLLLAFSVGRFPISPGDLMTVLWAKLTGGAHTLPATYDTVVFEIRAPRAIAAVVIGAALAAAGAVYQ